MINVLCNQIHNNNMYVFPLLGYKLLVSQIESVYRIYDLKSDDD